MSDDTTPKPGRRPRLQVFDRSDPPPENIPTDTSATPENNVDTVVFYERLDGTTGWFSEGALPDPYTSPACAGSKIRHFLVEARDEGNGQRSWIRFTRGPFDLLRPSNARHPYWQISVNEAAAWFSENYLSPPATLLDDLRAEQEATKAHAGPPPWENKQPPAVPTSGSKVEPPSSTKQKTRGPRRISKVQTALVILKYRASKARESIRVEDIAAEAECSPQNLYKSPVFQKEWGAVRARRIRRGWKDEGVADCLDESTLDVG